MAAHFKTVVRVRHECRRIFNEEPLHKESLRPWDKQLEETGNLSSVSDESFDGIRARFLSSQS
jgi:hypothetical protein